VTIPIANIYYLLLYAWRHVERRDQVDVGAAGKADLLNLLAHIYTLEVRRLVARGLAREYVPVEQEVAGILGKLDLGVTLKRDLLRHARTWCSFDEMTYDIPRNRIIKATLRLLLRVPELDKENRDASRHLHAKLDAVRDVPLHPSLYRGLQSHRLVREYDFALRLSRLISESVILDVDGNVGRFVDFSENDATMHKLFEDFVFNFYALERPEWLASRRTIEWFDAQGSTEALNHLPSMHTDVFLTIGDRQIVLDTKFYSKPLDGWQSDAVRSGNLYQLFSYVVNAAATAASAVDGILLYAAIDWPFAFRYRLYGHRLDVRALDLTQDWRSIHRDLLEFVTEVSPPLNAYRDS
jgi:5-methylcytosine-specific restriction enzyme subunit McrC